jgi:hypothetical protein
MTRSYKTALMILPIILCLNSRAFPQFQIDVETGGLFSGYNDVRIPGDTGTLFSLSEELEADPEVYFRARLYYAFNPRHTIFLLFAPLSVNSSGEIDRDITFQSVTFPANTPLETLYRFNSYRLSYRYGLYNSENIEFGLGLTAKIRDAEIRVTGGSLEAKKTNVGFVPLINFHFLWKFHERFGALLDGDALAAPQGRAEDILAAITYEASDRIQVRAGYRFLEGGADNYEVYGFALFHYLSLGVKVGF